MKIAVIEELKENDIICDFGIDISIYHVDKIEDNILYVTVLVDNGIIKFNKKDKIVFTMNSLHLIKDYKKVNRKCFRS